MSLFGKALGKQSGGPQQAFWEWFVDHSAELRQVKTGGEQICDDLMGRLQRLHKSLCFAFGPEVDGRREFVISADGIRAGFPAVQGLADSAPEMPGWRVTAFRPATGFRAQLVIGNGTYSVDDIWFSARPSGRTLDLVLFMKFPVEVDEKGMHQIAFLLLDHGLGEYAVAMALGRIDVRRISSAPTSGGLRPLRELPNVVAGLIARPS